MGWFEHGSTILVFGTSHFALCDDVRDGMRIEMGRPLFCELGRSAIANGRGAQV
jgi:hypothetical protein